MQICPGCGEENPAKFRLCGFCGTALAAELPPQEVRKTVTLVFSDLKGSTSLGEKLDSEALREVMSRYFEEMKRPLERHGGRIEKYIGDAIMAVFGLPRAHEDDALRAVRAAFEMKEALARLNDELERRWGVRLENRTGVNTGEVVSGDSASAQRLVTGDAVNVAARLEQAAPALDVLLGEPTYRLVRHVVEVEAVEPLELKGKSERVPAYRLLAVHATDEEIARRRDAPLVGRETESRVLRDAFDLACRDRRCQAVTLVGPAGLGKSRLTEEFAREARKTALVLRGRCLPYGEGITFWPLVEVLRQAAGLDHSDQADSAREKLAALLGPHEDVLARVASVAGLSQEQFPLQELFWGTRKLLELLSRDRPLVVVFEDLHWAEPTFLDLVEHLAETIDGSPVLLLCNARPELLEVRPGWTDAPNAAHVLLEPLGADASRRVIENMLGDAGLDETVRARIIDAAEGNPLFVEQLLSMLIDEGLVELQDGVWRASGELPAVTLPPTIQALLASRIDGLDPEERAVVEPAAVIGYVFPEDAVRELVPDAVREKTGAHLVSLGRKQLIRPEPAERGFEDPWRFDHVLIRDTTYEALLKRTRAALHERFVRWADRVNGDRAAEYEEILGYHLEQAYRYLSELGPLDDHGLELGVDAAARLTSAGRKARTRGDLGAAANLLERASRVLPELDEQRLSLLPEVAEVFVDLGRFADAEAFLDEAAAGADGAGDARLAAHARLIRLLLELRAGADERWSDGAVPAIEEAIEIFTVESDDAGLAKSWRLLAYVHGTACRYGEAAAACERALEHARRAEDSREERVNATSYALAACWGSTTVDEAIARCEAVIEQVAESRLSRGGVTCILGYLHAMRGEFELAREVCSDGRAAIGEMHAPSHAAWASMFAARIEMLAGDARAAEEGLRRASDLLEHMGERYLRSTVTALLARAVCAQDRLEEAYGLTELAEELAGADDVEAQAMWRSIRAAVLARQRRHDAAERLAQEAVQLLLDTDSAVMKVETLAELAEVYGLVGDSGAQWALDEARALATRKGNVAAVAALDDLTGRLAAQPARAS